MANSDRDDERRRRVKPHGSGAAAKSGPTLLAAKPKPKAAWLAPNAGDKNTFHFTTWVEVKVVTRHGVPLKNERVRCYSGDGRKLEQKTDARGIVRFSQLPIFDLKAAVDDLARPAISLPDVLEEWDDHDIGDFDKQDTWRRHDRAVHFVPVETTAHPIVIDSLTEEQKFQHFMKQYVDHGAKYTGASPRDYKTADLRWKWGKGAVCNQHTNFFLGYWLNFNRAFTTAASRTTTIAQLCYDSTLQPFEAPDTKKVKQADGTEKDVPISVTVKHRGYLDFLTPLDQFGKDFADFGDANATHETPPPAKSNVAYRTAKQVRMTRFFDPDSLLPNERGQALFAALGNFNVFAVSDIPWGGSWDKARQKTRAWLKKHLDRAEFHIPSLAAYPDAEPPAPPASAAAGGKGKPAVKPKPKPKTKTKAQVIDGLTLTILSGVIWQLEDEDETDRVLIKELRGLINWDHHAGVMLKRDASKGGEPFGEYDELWTFSADGPGHAGHHPIELKRLTHKPVNSQLTMAGTLRDPRFLHLVLCRIEPLQPGGYAQGVNDPPELADFIDELNDEADDKVTSLHLSRFIEWA